MDQDLSNKNTEFYYVIVPSFLKNYILTILSVMLWSPHKVTGVTTTPEL
jgi:hypothetical protein